MATAVQFTNEAEYSEHYPKLSSDLVTTHCTNVEDFLNTLFEISPRNRYIFRGQKCSHLPMIATLFRPEFIAKQEIDSWFSDSDGVRYSGEYYDRYLLWEDSIVRGFADSCMNEGIPLPHIPYNEELGFDTEAVSAYFVARNYEIPNRLLDFTRSPVVASWFAANDIGRSYSHQGTDNVVVWAISQGLLPEVGYNIVSTSWANAQIPQMQRQRAVLLVDTRGRENFIETGRFQPMEYTIEQLVGENADILEIHPMIRRVTLPQAECKNLMRELEKHELSEINLFPTLDMAAKCIMQEFTQHATIAKMFNNAREGRRKWDRLSLIPT